MRAILILLGASLALSGCGGEHEDLRAWMKDSTKDLRGRVQPLPEIRPMEIVAYEVANLVDPFRSSKIEPEKKVGGGGGLQPDFDRRKEPLEQYPLETLSMVGTLEQGKNVYAIIRADANLHRVRTGNYMGQNFGVITRVTESEVELKELVQDAAGDWVERTSTLQLQEQEASK